MSTELALEKKYINGMFLLGGIISLIFGVLLITRTQGVIEVIMLLLGLWWLIQGLFNILAIFIDKSQWGWNLIGGILGVIAGLLVLNHPVVGGAIVLGVWTIVIGVIGLLIGVISIVTAFQGAGWGAGIFGAVSALIGIFLVFNVFGALNIFKWIFAILLIFQGIVAIYIGATEKA
ncbi:MAG: HdeD family acid-resistance protein [Anaerolineales bacterium]|jgi:uncharacterized membrane protein HdeD (DUF308 family)